MIQYRMEREAAHFTDPLSTIKYTYRHRVLLHTAPVPQTKISNNIVQKHLYKKHFKLYNTAFYIFVIHWYTIL